jgi:hypothetical protein
MAPSQERKLERPVERRQVARPEPLGLPLTQPNPRHAHSIRDLVVERRRIATHPDHAGQSIEPRPGHLVHHRSRFQSDA